MINNKNFSFTTGISKECYSDKKEVTACLSSAGSKAIGRNKLAFQDQTLTISDFLDYASHGYCFCGLFDFDPNKEYWIDGHKTTPIYKRGENRGCMKISFKRDDFFRGSQVIFCDIDYTNYQTVPDYVSNLRYKPTAVYMSFSDNIYKIDVNQKNNPKYTEKGIKSRRFRLVYVFDEELNSKELKDLTYSINQALEEDTNEPLQDKCGAKVSQYFNGSNSSEVYNYGYIYNKSDIQLVSMPEEVEDLVISDRFKDIPEFEISKDLINDMKSLDYDTFMKYNRHRYTYTYRSNTGAWINGTYQYTSKNDFSLFWNTTMIQDGQKRRKKVFERMCLRRVMNPEITPDDTLFSAYEDVHRFFSNADGVFTTDLLVKNVESAFKLSIDEIKTKYSDNLDYLRSQTPRIIFKQGSIKSTSDRNINMKIINYDNIAEYYNDSISVAANKKALEKYGIKVSRMTLYSFCKDRGIDTEKYKKVETERILDLYDESVSLRDNVALLKSEGIKIGKDKLSQIIKEFNKENEGKLDLSSQVVVSEVKENLQENEQPELVSEVKEEPLYEVPKFENPFASIANFGFTGSVIPKEVEVVNSKEPDPIYTGFDATWKPKFNGLF